MANNTENTATDQALTDMGTADEGSRSTELQGLIDRVHMVLKNTIGGLNA